MPEPLDYDRGMIIAAGLNSAASIGDWVRAQLGSGEHENDFTARVITQETDRWFKNDLPSEEIEVLVSEPADTGDPRWTAFLEGVVARRLHEHRMKAPEWTRRTNLDDAWGPYEYRVKDNGPWLAMVLRTPSELLDKSVVFPRENLKRV